MPNHRNKQGDVPENLLRPRDAAIQLQISYPTIKQWIYHHKLQAVKTPGGHYRIPQSEVDRLLYRTRGHNEGERRVTYQRISGRNQLVGRIVDVRVSGLPGGAEVVFDYSNPPDSLPAEMRAVHEARAAHVAEIGEAWVSYFESDALGARLTTLGLTGIEDLGPPEIVARYFPERGGSAPGKGGHVVRAATF